MKALCKSRGLPIDVNNIEAEIIAPVIATLSSAADSDEDKYNDEPEFPEFGSITAAANDATVSNICG